MKSNDVKPAKPGTSGPRKPFFSGEGEVVQAKQQGQPFFRPAAHHPTCPAGTDETGHCIQTKLAIGKVGDSYEREADRNADNMVREVPKRDGSGIGAAEAGADERKPITVTPMTPGVQAKCAKCEAEDPTGAKRCPDCEREAGIAQRKHNAVEVPSLDDGAFHHDKLADQLESRLHASKGGGSPLPETTRQQMETSFGADFSGVRVHTGGEAAGMTESLAAHAFTHGGDIYFNHGKYDPKSIDGQRLLAHELTHTVQQGAAAARPPGAKAPGMRSPGEKKRSGVENKKAAEAKKTEDGKMPGDAKRPEEVKRPEDAKRQEDAKKKTETEKKDIQDKAGAAEGESAEDGRDAKETQDGKGAHGGKGTHSGKGAHGDQVGHRGKGEKGNAHGLIKEAGVGKAEDAAGSGSNSDSIPQGPARTSDGLIKADRSRARLGAVEAHLATLATGRPGFALAPNDAKDPQLIRQKQQTDDSVLNFLSDSSAMVRHLLAPGAQITSTVSAGAAAARATINAEARKQQAMARAEGRRLKKEAETRTWGVIAGINARHQRVVATLQADAQAAKAKIKTAHDAAVTSLENNIAQQLPKIDQAYTEGAEKYRQAGVTAGDYAVLKANEDAKRFRRLKEVHKELYNEDQAESALDGPMESKRWGAREDVAIEVGKAYRDGDTGLINEGKKQADELMNGPGRGMDIKHVNEISQASRQELATSYETALKNIESFTAEAVANAGKAKKGFVAGAHKALRGTLTALDGRLQQQLHMLQSYSQALTDHIDDQASGTIAELTDGLADAGQQLSDALIKFKSGIGASAVPDPAELQNVFGQMRAGIASAGAGMQANLNNRLTGAVETLTTGGGLAAKDLKERGASGLAEMRKLVSDLRPVLSRLTAGMISAFGQLEKNGAKYMDSTVATMTTSFMNISGAINQKFAELNSQLAKGLQDSAKERETAFKAAVDKEMAKTIQAEGDKAAAAVKPRWKSVLKFLVIVVVVLVVAAVVGPIALGFVTSAATALGASTTAAAVIGTIGSGAIVGMGTGGLIQIISNKFDNKKWSDGVFHAMVVGFITGAVGGAAGKLGEFIGEGAKTTIGAYAAKIGIPLLADFGTSAGIEFVDSRLEHRKMEWGQVFVQTAISLGSNFILGKIGKIQAFKSIQQWSLRLGGKMGNWTGAAIRATMGFEPVVRLSKPVVVHIADPLEVRAPEPPEVKTGEPVPPKATEPVAPKPTEPVAPKATEPAEAKPSGSPEPVERAASPESEPSEEKPANPEKPADIDSEKPFRASHPAQDGHTIKVMGDGRIVKCSNCAELEKLFAPELKGNESLKAEFEEIKNNPDPDKQAEAAAKFEKKLMKGIVDEYRNRVDDGISDSRIREYVNKGARLNPETGRFVGPGGLELKPDVEAVYDESVFGKKGLHFDPTSMDPATKSEFDAVLAEREAAKADRKMFSDETSDGYKAAEQRMRKASEKLGNLASDWVMKTKFDAEPIYTGEGSRKLDKVYVGKNGEIYIVEAKGGSGRLGVKQGESVHAGEIVEQGTKAYRDQTVMEMLRSGVKEQIDAAQKIIDAGDNVRYFQVDQPIDAAGNLDPARLREFKM